MDFTHNEQTIVRVLDDMGLPYVRYRNLRNNSLRFSIVLGMPGLIAYYHVVLMYYGDRFQVKTVFPMIADIHNSSLMNSLCKFICKVNSERLRGNLDLDLEDGRFGYKDDVICEGKVSEEAVKKAVINGVRTISKYEKGILAILYNQAGWKEAISLCN